MQMTANEIPPPVAEPGDAALLARLKRGDAAAFESLVRNLSPRLFAVARRMMGNDQDASDALQDAFVSAFKALGDFDGRSRLSTWLHRIVVNACLMRLRSEKRRQRRTIEEILPRFVADGHAAKSASAWESGPAAAPVREELRRAVREKIDELPEAYRTVLILRDIEQMTTEQAAAALGESESAVKTRLHRARLALRELLDPVMSRGSL